MAMLYMTTKGNYNKTLKWLQKLKEARLFSKLDEYGELGVKALELATPKDTGLTALSWYYEIIRDQNKISITWNNSNRNKGVPIAVLIQYGHGTGTGGYVQGFDYINPALKPVFDEITDKIWKEITNIYG